MIAALAFARLRRRPGRALVPGAGIAVAVAFACAVAGEATIAGDRSARAALVGASPVRVSARAIPAGPVAAVLGHPWLGPVTRAVLFESLRLGGRLVRLAAIAPLSRWSPGASTPPCAPAACPLLAAGGPAPGGRLEIPGLRLAGRARLASPVPLGFRPVGAGAYAPGEPAAAGLLLSGDVDGLARLPGLASFYRTTTWLAPLAVGPLHSWDLAGVERTLQRDQADLASLDPGLTFAAPFAALDAARAGAAAAPRRLLLAGGGAAAVLVAFVLLAAGSLRRDLASERDRLRVAGATRRQRMQLVALEAAGVSGLGALAGAAAGVALVAGLARVGGEPIGAVLGRSGLGAGELAGGWALGALVLGGALLVDVPTLALDLLGVAAAGALALALAGGGAGPPAVLVAPLGCLAGGLVVFRLVGLVLRAGERAVRTVLVPLRLALVNLARAPAAPAGAAAFLTISISLGAFALAYGATLDRGVADQAASEVPLEVTVSAGPSFASPLALAPLSRWQAIAGGPVLALRRTEASFASGPATATVPLLAIPAAGLRLLPGAPDGGRLLAPGPVRTAGPAIPRGAVALRVQARAAGIGVGLRAALRSEAGAVTTIAFGALGPAARRLDARVPAGSARLEALVLDEPAGLAATVGHQNAESPAPATASTATVTVVSVEAIGRRGQSLGRLAISGWRAHGAARALRPPGLTVGFDAAGVTGVLRPPQPGDAIPLPVVVDPSTAAAAGRGRRLELTVDGVTLAARVVGRERRFPTVGERFVLADAAALEARLDAAVPGAGQPNELWMTASDLARTRAALAGPRLAALTVAYRADVAGRLRSDPVFRGVARTLGLGALVAVVLAAAGLASALLGSRDRLLEQDLAAQGMGPRGLRRELRLRMLVIAGLGLLGGLAVGVALTRLAVAAVRGSPVGPPLSVPLLVVVPWSGLALLGLGAAAGLGAVGWAATRRVG